MTAVCIHPLSASSLPITLTNGCGLQGTPIPARITVRPDRSFHFELRTPNTSWLMLTAAGVEKKKGKLKGASNPGTEVLGSLSLKHVYEIAKIKRTVRLTKHELSQNKNRNILNLNLFF